MQLNIDAAVLISLSSGIVALSTLAYLFGRHNARGLAYLRTLMAGLVIWAILNALELAVTDYETKIWLSKFAYLGPFLVIPSWPFFVLAYNEKEKMLSRPFRVAIWTGSALMLLAVFTNELHNTIWTSVVPIPGAVGNRLVYYHGIAFYLYTAFSYVLIIYGALVLIISAGKAKSLYRKQNMLLLYSAAIPLVGNILYVSDLMPLRGVDFTALTFVISGLLITIDIKRYGLLDLLPIARERLFDSLQDAVVVLDNVGRLVDINTVGIKWFLSRNGASEAASAGNWKGESFSELVPELPDLKAIMANFGDSGLQIWFKGSRWLDLNRCALFGPKNSMDGEMLTFRDITEWREANLQLLMERQLVEEQRLLAEEARAEADRANNAKSSFLTNMSHEMRTPLIAITGFLPLLEELGLSHEQQKFSKEINTASEALLDLVNEILDLSRIESGKLELVQTQFRIDTLLEDCASLASVRLLRKPVGLTIEDKSSQAEVIGDKGRIRQMFLNILGNAAKFTESGSVRAILSVEEVEDAKVAIGSNISSFAGGSSFNSGLRNESAHAADEANKTQEQVDIKMKLNDSKSDDSKRDDSKRDDSKRDDSKRDDVKSDNAFIPARIVLEVIDTGPGVSEDVQLRLFEPFVQASADTSRKYGGSGLGLAITRRIARAMGGDVKLQSQSGIGSTFTLWFPTEVRGLRNKKELSFILPIITKSLVANGLIINEISAQPERLVTNPTGAGYSKVERSADLADQYSELVCEECSEAFQGEAIAGMYPKRTCSESLETPKSASNTATVLNGCHVLLVEDTIANQKLISHLLTRLSCRVTIAGNGKEAVEGYFKVRPDIIFMDIQMPVMDGLEATRIIRSVEGNAERTPIVAMTANALAGEKQECLESGMDDFLTKPLKPKDLEYILNRWASKHPR